MWLSKDVLQDSSWSSPQLLFHHDIHSNLLTHHDGKEVCSLSQSHVHVGTQKISVVHSDRTNHVYLNPLFHRSTVSMSHSLCGERTLPMLLLLSSRHCIALHTRSSSTGRPFETSNLRLRSRVVLNSFVFGPSSASLPPLRTLSFGQRLPT